MPNTTTEYVVRLESPGPPAWRQGDLVASESDPYLTGLSEERANHLVETAPFEHVDAEDVETQTTLTDRIETVLDGSLNDLEEALATGDFDAYLDVMAEQESATQDRDGAHNLIQARQGELGLDTGETAPDQDQDQETWSVDVLDGIGSSYTAELRNAGIETVGDLAATDAEAVAEDTDISTDRAEEWVTNAVEFAAENELGGVEAQSGSEASASPSDSNSNTDSNPGTSETSGE